MFNLIPISLLIMALGGVIYIASNHLSEFEENDEVNGIEFGIKAKLANWINQLPLESVKSRSLSLTQKFLRRMRIIILKTDNHLVKLIGKISEKTEKEKEKAAPNNFWKDFSDDDKKNLPEKIIKSEPEVKIDLTFKSNPETEKFFEPIRNRSKKVDGILTSQVTDGVEIQPVKKVFPLRGITRRVTKSHLTDDHLKSEKRQKK